MAEKYEKYEHEYCKLVDANEIGYKHSIKRQRKMIEHIRELQVEVGVLRKAAQDVIDMNIQQAIDQYGDAEKAESWACVKRLRKVLLILPEQNDDIISNKKD